MELEPHELDSSDTALLLSDEVSSPIVSRRVIHLSTELRFGTIRHNTRIWNPRGPGSRPGPFEL